ncbi:MAG: hypothetical protein M3Y72_03865 [Acidobacteriota bacterium]|nr:hypothetical protein [Acidobacteriota bacterium]
MNQPPAGWDKKHFTEGVAELAQELTEAKSIAEGRAAYLQQVFKKTPEKLGTVSGKYDEAAGKYNGVCAYLEVILSGNQRPTSVPKLDDARTAYKAFIDEATMLSGQLHHGNEFTLAAALPIGDIFKGVDTVLKAIEWFKERHEKEKLRVVEALKRTEWNKWTQAGSPEPPKKEGEPKQGEGKGAKAGE